MRDTTFAEELQRVRAGNRPYAYAAIRNLAIGAFRLYRSKNLSRSGGISPGVQVPLPAGSYGMTGSAQVEPQRGA